MMNKHGKYWFELDTSVTGGEVESIWFPLKADRDARLQEYVSKYGIEVINAIGDSQ
jgi:hypothetical protein